MGPSSWTNWSRELKYPLEQESQVSELATMLCSYVLSLYPSGERGGEYLIVSCKMEHFLAEDLEKNSVTSYNIALRSFLCKANYHHVKKLIYLNSSWKEHSNYLVASEERERQGSTLQFFSCIQEKNMMGVRCSCLKAVSLISLKCDLAILRKLLLKVR